MANNVLKTIALGTPRKIEGGAAPNAELTIESADNLEELTLHDGDDGSLCTKQGAMKTFSELMRIKSRVKFADPEVERVLREHITAADGVAITAEEAENVTALSMLAWFEGNATIKEFDELKYFKNETCLPSFANCSQLKHVNCNNIETANPAGVRKGTFLKCSSLSRVGDYDDVAFMPKIKISTGSFEQQLFAPSAKVKIIILPKIEEACYILSGYGDLAPLSVEVIDLGCRVVDVPSYAVFGVTSNVLSFIIRTITPPTCSSQGVFMSATPKYVFVPSQSVDAYKAADGWSSLTNYIKPIGGTEWVAEFGSDDEFADVDKYVTDADGRKRIRESFN